MDFILGLFVGSTITTIIMGLIQASKHNEILKDGDDEK